MLKRLWKMVMPQGLARDAASRADRRRWLLLAGVAAFGFGVVAGCGCPARFPPSPLAANPTATGLMESYDTNGDGKADYFTFQDSTGRKVVIGYDTNRDGQPDQFINLDEQSIAGCRHVIFILDGVGYDVVDEFRREGRLRLFYPPCRIISTFPAMTDLALADAFRSVKCVAYEVVYFDHQSNRLVGGDADYLGLINEAWVKNLAYRAGTIWDPLAYLYPDSVFNMELGDFRKVFARRDRTEVAAYFVGTAGMGTRQSKEGQRKVLDLMDRMAEELVWRTHGLVKITMLSDHGHVLVRCQRIDFGKFLTDKGWRATDRLERPRDVAPIEYGIVTYAAFATHDKPGLSGALLQHPGVDLVTYAEGEGKVIVEKPGARACVERRGNRYRYRPLQGDPLELVPVIEAMRASAKAGGPAATLIDDEGFAEDAAWFERTLTHRYPDAPNRLWRAFFDLVENAPDVVASLKEGYCAGSASRAFWLPYIASTHGDLERKSSTAFIMATGGPLLPPETGARSRDIPAIMEKLLGRAWPMPCEGISK